MGWLKRLAEAFKASLQKAVGIPEMPDVPVLILDSQGDDAAVRKKRLRVEPTAEMLVPYQRLVQCQKIEFPPVVRERDVLPVLMPQIISEELSYAVLTFIELHGIAIEEHRQERSDPSVLPAVAFRRPHVVRIISPFIRFNIKDRDVP